MLYFLQNFNVPFYVIIKTLTTIINVELKILGKLKGQTIGPGG